MMTQLTIKIVFGPCMFDVCHYPKIDIFPNNNWVIRDLLNKPKLVILQIKR